MKLKDKNNDYMDVYSKNEKKLFYMRNRTMILERRIIITVLTVFILLIGYIAAKKVFALDSQGSVSLKTDSINGRYLDKAPISHTPQEEEDEDEAYDYSKSIICWGDSFSDNTANSTNFYTYYLSQQLNQIGADVDSVFSSGLEGDSILAIAAKQGGIPMEVSPFTIPADKTPVEISLKSTLNGSPIHLQDKLNSGLNPCEISGVKGTIEYKGGKQCFIREHKGSAVEVKADTRVITNAYANIKDYTGVYFFGGDCTAYTPDELVSLYKSMIDFNGSDKFVVIGSVMGDEETMAPYEEALTNEFKSHYINLRKYLTSDVFGQYDITITANDAKALRAGAVPPCFILNGKRLSDQGSEITAKLLYDKLMQLELISY